MTPQNYGVPSYMVPGLRRYIDHGEFAGFLLTAVLCNDSDAAILDDTSLRQDAHACLSYLKHMAPPECWGSREKVVAWIDRHERARATYEGSEA